MNGNDYIHRYNRVSTKKIWRVDPVVSLNPNRFGSTEHDLIIYGNKLPKPDSSCKDMFALPLGIHLSTKTSLDKNIGKFGAPYFHEFATDCYETL